MYLDIIYHHRTKKCNFTFWVLVGILPNVHYQPGSLNWNTLVTSSCLKIEGFQTLEHVGSLSLIVTASPSTYKIFRVYFATHLLQIFQGLCQSFSQPKWAHLQWFLGENSLATHVKVINPKKLMGSRTLCYNLKGSAEPVEPVLTRPLSLL